MENHPDHGTYVDSLSFKKPWVSGKIAIYLLQLIRECRYRKKC